MLGANYPAALPVLAYRKYTDVDLAARPEAMAMAIVIALLSAVMIFSILDTQEKELEGKNVRKTNLTFK